MPHGIKRGATVLLALQFTEQEWEAMAPITESTAKLRIGNQYYSFNVTVNAANRALLLRSETAAWDIGTGQFDVSAVHGGKIAAFPQLTNVPFPVIQGVSL